MNPIWSILVCCHNSEHRLPKTLAAIARQTLLYKQIIELVIVDNASTDATSKVAEEYHLPNSIIRKVVFEPRAGLSNARAAAVKNSRGRYLCWLDDDNTAFDDYLEKAQAILDENSNICFCGGESFWPHETVKSNLHILGRYFSKAVAIGSQRDYSEGLISVGDFLWGAGLCVRSDEIKKLYSCDFQPLLTGRLGTKSLSGEDGELTILMQFSGKRGFYSSALRLEHRIEMSRISFRYYSGLFYGMGMAYPILLAYRDIIKSRNCEIFGVEVETLPPKPSRLKRLLVFSFWDIIKILLLYCWLLICFMRGIMVSRKSKLPEEASRRAFEISQKWEISEKKY